VVIPLRGEVSQAQFFFLRRILKAGEAADASAFILDMDTPGGELGAAVEILQALLKVKAPTFTYVNPNAGSAGALIALGTKQIWMAPVSAIGAAAPVMGGGQEIPETLGAKIVSYYSGYFRSAAENNGHNPEIAEAFINKEKAVKIGGREIDKRGELLTLSAQEAAEKIGGRPLLAAGIADSVADLVQAAGLQGPVSPRSRPSSSSVASSGPTSNSNHRASACRDLSRRSASCFFSQGIISRASPAWRSARFSSSVWPWFSSN